MHRGTGFSFSRLLGSDSVEEKCNRGGNQTHPRWLTTMTWSDDVGYGIDRFGLDLMHRLVARREVAPTTDATEHPLLHGQYIGQKYRS
jgi:hypothetical protein